MYRIFIVEDDRGIAEEIEKAAKMWGFEAKTAENLHELLSEFAEYKPHIVLMDIVLPYFSGYYWCGEIRKLSKVPIIFISSA